MERLPVDGIVRDVVDAVAAHGSAIVQAAPGSGKTTRIPPALLQFPGDVLVLEPRRLAARLAARRVAFEHGEEVGGQVGYQVRFEQAAGPRTRLRYITEGILVRRILSDPLLQRVSSVVLDEFHERRIDTDLALALLLHLRETKRQDLRVVIMSATLEPGPLAGLLGGAPVIQSSGRLHELSIEFTPCSAAPLEEQVAAAVERVVSQPGGDVLVFLPGAAEIRNAARSCERVCAQRGIETAMLHGDMPAADQNRAAERSSRRRIILSTNVAESSVTIPGVTVVIDSGLARVAGHSPWTGLPTLTVRRVSKASAQQRAGRAARVAPGLAIRLYTADDYARRPEHDTPEILRGELAQLCLDLRAAGIADARRLRWLDPPPMEALRSADELLRRIEALDDAGQLTAAGRAMVRLPVHPRIGRLVSCAAEAGAAVEGCRAAALLSTGARAANIDLLSAVEGPLEGPAEQALRQLRTLVKPRLRAEHPDEALSKAVLLAFPDRVARRREGRQILFSGGGSGILAGESTAAFLVALDAEFRSDQALPLVRLICPIRPEWLLDFFPDRLTEQTRVEWNRHAERVESVSTIVYDQLAIEDSRTGAVDPSQAAALLASKALEAGVTRFVDTDAWNELVARIDFAAQHAPVRPLDDSAVAAAVSRASCGLRSFAQLKESAGVLLSALEEAAGGNGLLDQVAPRRLQLRNGRNVRVHYEKGRSPWIASRLQDFFGTYDTPRIARGAVPLVIHLLAPNQRPVQTTTDLAGFWERLYPELRRQLSRRYPKHAWPEKP